MKDEKRNAAGELMELKHDARPGYKAVFFVVFVVAIIYLAIIFLNDPSVDARHENSSGVSEVHPSGPGPGDGDASGH